MESRKSLFIGQYEHGLDDKNRLFLPSRFREKNHGPDYILTQGLESCLFLFPVRQWEALAEKLEDLSLTNKMEARAFKRIFLSAACEAEVDSQGRILIPQHLKEYAKMTRDVVVLGVLRHVELWSKETLDRLQQESAIEFRESSSRPRAVSVRYEHLPVLADEVVAAFDFGRPAFIVDATLGLGGHSERLLERYPDLTLLGLEWDAEAIATARERLARFADRFQAVDSSYVFLPSVLSQRGRETADGILLDLGLSSFQLQDSSRGFSFLRPGPLDMRMSQSLTQSAWHILMHSSEDELARLFRIYGEEPQARKIARALKLAAKKNALPNDAWQVAEIIRKTAGSPNHRIDPATRCFQALRIVVNAELSNVDTVLGHVQTLLAPKGRAAIISFHSLEDRRVKNAFQAAAKGCVCPPRFPQCVCGKKPWGRIMTRKPIIATPEETAQNPRSRSAKLRVLEHL